MTRPGLAARDDPVDALEVEPGQRPEQRLAREEPHRHRHRSQFVRAPHHRLVLDRRAEPEVLRPRQPIGEQPRAPSPLRQHLVSVLWRVVDHVEDVAHEPDRHLRVEQVTHRVHEDHARSLPRVRHRERGRMHRHTEPRPAGARVAVALVLRRTHRLEPLRERQRVAVRAALGDAITTGRGVPGRFRPLDRRPVRHATPPLRSTLSASQTVGAGCDKPLERLE